MREDKHSAVFNVGTTVIYPRETETAYPIREEQFITLCEGETAEAKSNCKEYKGYAVGAAIGMLGLLAGTDLQSVWGPGHTLFFVSFLALFGLGLVSAALSLMHLKAYERTRTSSSYARTKTEVSAYFTKLRQNAQLHTAQNIEELDDETLRERIEAVKKTLEEMEE